MRRKLLAIIATLAVAVAMMPSMVFAASDTGYKEPLPAGPDMSGTVVNVTPENAQYTLDGAYGSIDGKTINFTGGEYTETLVLGRTTKYSKSNTKYYKTNDGPELSYEDVASITGAPNVLRLPQVIISTAI